MNLISLYPRQPFSFHWSSIIFEHHDSSVRVYANRVFTLAASLSTGPVVLTVKQKDEEIDSPLPSLFIQMNMSKLEWFQKHQQSFPESYYAAWSAPDGCISRWWYCPSPDDIQMVLWRAEDFRKWSCRYRWAMGQLERPCVILPWNKRALWSGAGKPFSGVIFI